jgi:hypothetical protein
MTVHERLNKAIDGMPDEWADPTIEVTDTMRSALLIYRATFGEAADVDPVVVWNITAKILARHDDRPAASKAKPRPKVGRT